MVERHTVQMYKRFAAVYDAIYSFKNYAEESEKLVAIVRARKPDAQTLLDVACGTGAHLEHLRKSFQCMGVDLSDELLWVARHKLQDVEFLQGDMRKFSAGRQYDTLTCLFSAIAYMLTVEDLQSAIANFAKHLVKGGVMIVEPWIDRSQFKSSHYDLMTAETETMKIARANNSWLEGDVSVMDFHFLVATANGVDHFSEVHRMGMFSRDQYLAAFESANLKVEFDEKGPMGRGLYIATN